MIESKSSSAKSVIHHSELKRLLSYDRDTGSFTWLVSPRNGVPVGAAAGNLAHVNRIKRYCQIRIGGRNYYAHRLAWLYVTGEWPASQVDHKDGDSTNNAWLNLREATPASNQQNRKAAQVNSATGVIGVSPSSTKGRYQARIKLNGKRIYLGSFDCIEAASQEYLRAKRELHLHSLL